MVLRKEYLVQQSGVPGNSCFKFQEGSFILSNVVGSGCLTAIYFWKIPVFLW